MNTRPTTAPTCALIAVLVTALTCAATTAWAQDRADMDRTRITGNRELPKVLYIVPWKKPLPGDLAGRPLVSVLDEALAPLDRDVVRREVRYEALTQTTQKISTYPTFQRSTPP
jgi:hypothetical protein